MTTRGFLGRRPSKEAAQRLPPGQYETEDFPVLSMGPTPDVDLATWRSRCSDGPRRSRAGPGTNSRRCRARRWRGDIHCVTKWSKFDTAWEGVTVDDLLAAAGIAPPTAYLLAHSYDGYATNVPGRRSRRRQGDDRDALRRRAAPAGARRPGAAARAAPLFLEEREVGEGPALHPARRGRASGSCAATTCTAIPGASSATPTIRDDGRVVRDVVALAAGGHRAGHAPDAAREERLPALARCGPSRPASTSTCG